MFFGECRRRGWGRLNSKILFLWKRDLSAQGAEANLGGSLGSLLLCLLETALFGARTNFSCPKVSLCMLLGARCVNDETMPWGPSLEGRDLVQTQIDLNHVGKDFYLSGLVGIEQ